MHVNILYYKIFINLTKLLRAITSVCIFNLPNIPSILIIPNI